MAVSEAEKKPDNTINKMSTMTSVLTEISFKPDSPCDFTAILAGNYSVQHLTSRPELTKSTELQPRTWCRNTLIPEQ